jgi:hypothetical protein
MMTTKEHADDPNVEIVTDYPGHKGPLYMETSYVGCVLSMYERNGRDDSDFLAVVWDEQNQCVTTICYASTRGWSYPNGARVDATDEVKEKAKQYLFEKRLPLAIRNDTERAKERAAELYKGCSVVVARGRKVPKGVRGTIFWLGETQWGTKVGIDVGNYADFPDHDFDRSKYDQDERIVWTYAKNVDAIDKDNYEQYLTPRADIEQRVMSHCENEVNGVCRYQYC